MNASDRLAAWTDLIHRQTHPTGPEHPNLYGLSPLTIAALAGNTTRVQELLNAGEHPDTRDEWGFTPVMHALRHAALNPEYATGPFPTVFQHLAPAHLDVQLNGVTRRITRGEGTYLVLLRLLSQIGTVGFATMNLNPDDVDRYARAKRYLGRMSWLLLVGVVVFAAGNGMEWAARRHQRHQEAREKAWREYLAQVQHQEELDRRRAARRH